MNTVILEGVVIKDAALKTSKIGKPYLSFSLATEANTRKGKGGVQMTRSVFHLCIQWNSDAETARKVKIGARLHVEGSLDSFVALGNKNRDKVVYIRVRELRVLDVKDVIADEYVDDADLPF